jgi:acetoin utilization protein AcuB
MPLILIDDGVRKFIPNQKPVFQTPGLLGVKNEKIDEEEHKQAPSHQSFAARLAQKNYNQGKNPFKERKKIIYANEIMSSPVTTLPSSTTLAKAWFMIQSHRFRHIPIVNESGAPVGIVSDRDLLKVAMTLDWNIFQEDDPAASNQTVGMHFTSPVLAVLPNTEIHSIAKAMFENHIGAMPIINDQNAVIGIITRSDILRALIHMGPLEIWG